MRIISKDHDYYDSALAHGADMTLVYERSTREIDGRLDDLGEPLDLRRAPKRDGYTVAVRGGLANRDRFMPAVLLFCGRAYPHVVHDHYDRPIDGRTRSIHWTPEAVEAAVEASGDRGRWDATGAWYGGNRPLSRVTVADWFAATTPEARAAEVHHLHGTPVILYRSLTDRREFQTVLDPNLKELGFFRVRDSFAAFQEIAMYLGGVLKTNERPMAEISDKVRAEKHGMDAWSFRRPPAGPAAPKAR